MLFSVAQHQDVSEPQKEYRHNESSRTAASLKSTVSEMSERLHSEIRNLAFGIVTPLTDDLPKEEFENLLSKISEKAQDLSEDIGAALGPNTSNRLCKNIKLKIKNFFTDCIAKVWSPRMLEQLKAKYEPQSASKDLLESLADGVSSQLQMCIYREEKPAEGNTTNLCFNAAVDDINTYIEELKDEGAGLRVAHEEGEDREGGMVHITQETLVYYHTDNILLMIYKKTHLYAEHRHHLHNRLFEVISSSSPGPPAG